MDTTFLIDIVESQEDVRRASEDLKRRGEVLVTTAFNAYEALLGVESVRDRTQRVKLLDFYAKVLARLIVLPLSLEDAAKAAEIGGELRAGGMM